MGRLALVTSAFPAGLRRGGTTTLTLTGANLGTRRVPARNRRPMPRRATGVLRFGGSNGVALRVGERDEVAEAEPNDSDEAPQTVTVPAAINGQARRESQGRRHGRLSARRRSRAGRDVPGLGPRLAARFAGRPGPDGARREGRAPRRENDDTGGRDARLERAIDAKGLLVAVRDYYGRGGDRFVYRLEVEPIAAAGRHGHGRPRRAGRAPRAGAWPLAVNVERRGYDGPVTVLAGETPEGVSAVPVTIAERGECRFVDRLGEGRRAGRSVPVPPDGARRRGARRVRLPRADARRATTPKGWLVVADPAALGVRIEPDEIVVAPGGKATVKVVLDRRGEAAKKAAVKVKLVAAEGNLDGFEPVAEATAAVGSDTATFELKAQAGRRRRREGRWPLWPGSRARRRRCGGVGAGGGSS